MPTTRWDPFQEMLSLREQVDRLFSPVATRLRQAWFPPADVYERPDAILVVVDLPGVRPEDVQIQIEDHTLTLRGERRLTEVESEGHEHVERPSGSFERHVSLPATAAAEGVQATYEDGVLEVRVPKTAAPEARRIEIQRGNLHSRTEGRDGPLREVAIGETLEDTELGKIDPDGTTEYDPRAHGRRDRPEDLPRVEGGAGI